MSNYLERMEETWVGVWTLGKVVENYLERMQERWVGLCKEEGGEELPGENLGEVGWPLAGPQGRLWRTTWRECRRGGLACGPRGRW